MLLNNNLLSSISNSEQIVWRIRQEEMMCVFKEVVEAIVLNLGGKENDFNEDKNLLRILSSKFAIEASSLIISYINFTRSRNKDAFISLAKENYIWQVITSENDYDVEKNAFFCALRKGLPKQNNLKKFLRPLKDIVFPSNFIRRSKKIHGWPDKISCITFCPLTNKHAEEAEEQVIYTNIAEWFSEVDKERMYSTAASTNKSIESLLETIYNNVSLLDLALPKKLHDYLCNWLRAASSIVRYYNESIKKEVKCLPKNLWTGTSGILWSRILANLVMAEGGIVTGHDHAWGSNFSLSSLAPFTEFQFCNNFYTFTERQARLYKRISSFQLFNKNKTPTILYPKETANIPIIKEKYSDRKLDILDRKKVLYVAPFLNNYTFGPAPLMPPVIAIDWVERIINFLVKSGYYVLVKPHPENVTKYPDDFKKIDNVSWLSGKLEDVYLDADYILYDWFLTTTFGFGLRTDKSIVCINFGQSSFPEEEKMMLEARCAFVDGYYDKNNRAYTDWDKLLTCFPYSDSLRDYSCIKILVGM